MSAGPARWVLRHRHGEASAAELAQIRSAAGVRVVEGDGRILLVEGREEVLRALAVRLPGWTLVPERTTPPPRG